MAVIKPFRGIIYSTQKINEIANVFSPPYDVLSEDDVKRYEKKHEFNVVRLIQSRNGRIGRQKLDKYAMAANCFKHWRRDGILLQDKTPSIYIYEHRFTVNKNGFRRIGFISAVKIEDFSSGRVLPHENTFAGPIEDRFKLTVATKANLCPIFSIFSDSDGEITKFLEDKSNKVKIYSAEDQDGGLHTLYRISAQQTIEEVKKIMHHKIFLIADGHHRYESALRYRDYVHSTIKDERGEIPADYVMMYLTPMESSGLVLFCQFIVLLNYLGL